MTNENNLKSMIENKKQVELVQELKDEYKVPSFEEFMENYQGGNLNYDDLNSGSVGEVKGYGPVVQSDYYGDWEYLEIPCVSKTCSTNDTTPRRWVHDEDDCNSRYTQYMLWSTQAKIKCIYCDRPSHISNWAFKCHRCPKYGDYDMTKFLTAIRIVSKISPANADFADKLYDYMAHNQSEFN